MRRPFVKRSSYHAHEQVQALAGPCLDAYPFARPAAARKTESSMDGVSLRVFVF